jgi:hypothetical protein
MEVKFSEFAGDMEDLLRMISSRLARERWAGFRISAERCWAARGATNSKQMRESFFGLFLTPVFYVVIMWITEKIRGRRPSATHRTTEFPADASVVEA